MSEQSEEKSAGSKKDRNVYVTFIGGGTVKSASMTRHDAEKAGVFHPQAYSMLSDQDEVEVKAKSLGMTCPHCGHTQKDFERLGRLGCPRCFEVFQPVLMPLLRRMHRGSAHVGKVPDRRESNQIFHNRLSHLQRELGLAVQSERYEDAALMRDKIQDIQIKLGLPSE